MQKSEYMEWKIAKPDASQSQIIDCPENNDEVLDPLGYFLIRYTDKLEVGLCKYGSGNVIIKTWTGNKPQDVYKKIIADLPSLTQTHCAYLGKELTRCYLCLKLGLKYIQDGTIKGDFPEIYRLYSAGNSAK